MSRFSTYTLIWGCLAAMLGTCSTNANDWPTWRHDAQRSGASDEQLPGELKLQWSVTLPPNTPAWPEDKRIQFDAIYEPIVADGTLFVASAENDSILAVDAATGKRKWQFFANGPIRLAPVANSGRLYFGSDDGCLYCLAAETGKQVWKLDMAPGARRILGNDRVISVWPVRGGPVIVDGKLYCTCGVWPFEGIFLYTVDVATGETIDVSGTGEVPNYVDTTLPSMTPQGYLVHSDGRLFIPGGRALPACVDLKSGQFIKLRYDSRGKTDYHVATRGPWLFHGGRMYNVDQGLVASQKAPRPVATDAMAYTTAKSDAIAYDLNDSQVIEGKDRRGRPTKTLKVAEAWRLPLGDVSEVPKFADVIERSRWMDAHPVTISIKSGTRLYGFQHDTVFSVDLPNGEEPGKLNWKATVEGSPATMLTADGRLYVVTREGSIACFSGDEPGKALFGLAVTDRDTPEDRWKDATAQIVEASGAKEGFAVVVGAGSGRLIDELVAQTDLRVIVVDDDAERVHQLRTRLVAAKLYGHRVAVIASDPFVAAKLYGHRVAVIASDPSNAKLPPYIANLVVSETLPAAAHEQPAAFTKWVYGMLRPYGGTACMMLDDAQFEHLEAAVDELDLVGAKVTRHGDALSTLTREGALSGSAPWTHEYGDAANTLMSQDDLVRAPLGLLWFGGPSSNGSLYYDRHDWGPSMVVVRGRIFIQGPEKLTAVDVYTGRVLWQRRVKKGVSPGRRGNFVSTGHHLLGTSDSLYLGYSDRCLRIDLATGETLSEIKLESKDAEMGRIRVVGDLLVTAEFRKTEEYGDLPIALVGMDRMTGKQLWRTAAGFSFPFFAVGDDKIYCFDGVIYKLYHDMRRKGLVPEAADERYVVALDLATGKELWRQPTEMIVTWLSYAKDLNVVVISNKSGVAAHEGESGELLWNRVSEGRGFIGHPESVWDKVIVYNDRIIDQRGPGTSYYLETGQPITRTHPITGESVAWEFTKSGHHCNYAIASPHLVTFRAAEAGFFDMVGNGTCRLDGFRSGCRNSLLPADGVLNAPNFAHGCICDYSLFTSLSFVHVPDADLWSYSALKAGDGPVKRVGINLGAPGDRQGDNGTLWLDYPSVGGSSPDLKLEFKAEKPKWLRRHARQFDGEGLRWVAASGVEGAESIKIPLGRPESQTVPCTVRLYFAELAGHAPGERVFDVALQGKTVLEDFDIAAETANASGSPLHMIVKEFTAVEAADALVVEFTSKTGRSLVCGVEVVAGE